MYNLYLIDGILSDFMGDKYSSDSNLLGLGKVERERFSLLLAKAPSIVSVDDAMNVWNLERAQVRKLLSRFCKKGWLSRISRGAYIPVPLESRTNEVIPEEPFVIAEKLFSPCYIAGANAVHHWQLTDQFFPSITVMTMKKSLQKYRQEIAGTVYELHAIHSKNFFGVKNIWFDEVKVQISDPTRTIVDLMLFPQHCGGIRFIEETLNNYIQSDYKDNKLLVEYLTKINNGAALKRLGFLLELNHPTETDVIEYCKANLTAGYAKLSPNIDCNRQLSRWRLWLPDYWKERFNDQKK